MSDRLRIGLLLAAALLPYSNSLWNAFTLDDDSYILQNPAVTSVSLKLLLQPSRVNDHFRPVTFGSFALNWAIGAALLGDVLLGLHLRQLRA